VSSVCTRNVRVWGADANGCRELTQEFSVIIDSIAAVAGFCPNIVIAALADSLVWQMLELRHPDFPIATQQAEAILRQDVIDLLHRRCDELSAGRTRSH
jgi:hypothetical protein